MRHLAAAMLAQALADAIKGRVPEVLEWLDNENAPLSFAVCCSPSISTANALGTAFWRSWRRLSTIVGYWVSFGLPGGSEREASGQVLGFVRL